MSIPIHRKAVGRIEDLGALYNAYEDKFCSSSIFSGTLPGELVISSDNQTTSVVYVTSDTLEEKMNKLKIEADLQLSIRCDLVKVSGHGDFLKDNNCNDHEVSGSMICQMTMKKKSINMNDKKVIELFAENAVNNRLEATHVVTAIEYGAIGVATITLSRKFSHSSSKSNMRGTLESYMGKLEATIKSGEYYRRDSKNLNAAKEKNSVQAKDEPKSDKNERSKPNSKQLSESKPVSEDASNDQLAEELNGEFVKNEKKDFALKFFIDGHPGKIPLKADEHLEFFQNIPSLLETANGKNGVPISYTLTPISSIKKALGHVVKDDVLHSLEDDATEKVNDTMESLMSSAAKFDALKKMCDDNQQYLSEEIKKKIRERLRHFSQMKRRYSKQIQSAVVNIRKGHTANADNEKSDIREQSLEDGSIEEEPGTSNATMIANPIEESWQTPNAKNTDGKSRTPRRSATSQKKGNGNLTPNAKQNEKKPESRLTTIEYNYTKNTTMSPTEVNEFLKSIQPAVDKVGQILRLVEENVIYAGKYDTLSSIRQRSKHTTFIIFFCNLEKKENLEDNKALFESYVFNHPDPDVGYIFADIGVNPNLAEDRPTASNDRLVSPDEKNANMLCVFKDWKYLVFDLLSEIKKGLFICKAGLGRASRTREEMLKGAERFQNEVGFVWNKIAFGKLEKFDCSKKDGKDKLKEKIGYVLYEKSSYSEEEKRKIDNIGDTFISKQATNNAIHIAFVFVNYFYPGQFERTLVLFKFPKGRQMCFMEPSGKTYTGWQDFLDNNNLPRSTLVFPKNGKYTYFNGRTEIETRQSTSTFRRLVKMCGMAMDIGVSVATLTGSILTFTSSAPIGAEVLMKTAAVATPCSVIRSLYRLYDRGSHGESMRLFGDWNTFACWLSFFGSAASGAAICSTWYLSSLAAKAIPLNTATKVIANVAIFSNLSLQGVGLISGGRSIFNKLKNNEKISILECLQFSASLIFFSNTVLNLKRQTAGNTYNSSSAGTCKDPWPEDQRANYDAYLQQNMKATGSQGAGGIKSIQETNKMRQKNDLNFPDMTIPANASKSARRHANLIGNLDCYTGGEVLQCAPTEAAARETAKRAVLERKGGIKVGETQTTTVFSETPNQFDASVSENLKANNVTNIGIATDGKSTGVVTLQGKFLARNVKSERTVGGIVHKDQGIKIITDPKFSIKDGQAVHFHAEQNVPAFETSNMDLACPTGRPGEATFVPMNTTYVPDEAIAGCESDTE